MYLELISPLQCNNILFQKLIVPNHFFRSVVITMIIKKKKKIVSLTYNCYDYNSRYYVLTATGWI